VTFFKFIISSRGGEGTLVSLAPGANTAANPLYMCIYMYISYCQQIESKVHSNVFFSLASHFWGRGLTVGAVL